jgi:hypothetical protein
MVSVTVVVVTSVVPVVELESPEVVSEMVVVTSSEEVVVVSELVDEVVKDVVDSERVVVSAGLKLHQLAEKVLPIRINSMMNRFKVISPF